MRRRAGVIGALMAILVATMVGCPGPTFVVQQYGGPARPPETVAILRVNGGDAVRLLALDEQDAAAPLESDSKLHIEILPGRHSVAVTNGKVAQGLTQRLDFVAEAGKFYRVAFDDAGVAHVHEVERGSDTLRREVTVAPAPASAAPPRRPASPILPDAGATPTDDAGTAI